MKTIRKNSIDIKHFRIILIGLVCFLGLFGIIATNGDDDNGEVKKPFILAFIDTDWRLQIRWSNNGLNWESATIGNTPIDRGPGLACDDTGVLYITAFGNTVSKAQYNRGVGPSTWDNSPTTIGDGHTGLIDSGSSIAYLDGNKYLVTFVSGDQTKVYVLNTSNSSRDFESDVTPVIGVINNNVDDRPALIRLNEELLAGWITTEKQLQLVKGKIVSGAPEWDAGYTFNVPETGFYSPESVIDLATDGNQFYLALLRESHASPGNTFADFHVFIYTSTNGLNWTKLTSHSTGNINIRALSIAASGSNDIISIESGGLRNAVMRYNGTTWSSLNVEQVFGDKLNNVGHDLTLFKRY